MLYLKDQLFKNLLLIGIIGFLLLATGFFIFPKTSFAQDDLVPALREKCYDPILARYQEVKNGDSEYLLGLPSDQAMSLLDELQENPMSFEEPASAEATSEIFAKLEERFDELKDNPELCELRKNRNLEIIQLSKEAMQCYREEAKNLGQDISQPADSYIQYYAGQIEAINNFDCQQFAAAQNENKSIIKLAPYETKYLEVGSFCLDGEKELPAYGDGYEYGSNISELGRKNLENFILASIVAPDQRFNLQAAIWSDAENQVADNEAEFIKLAQAGRENRERQITQMKADVEKSENRTFLEKIVEKIKILNKTLAILLYAAIILFIVALVIFLLKLSNIKKHRLFLILYIILLAGLLVIILFAGLNARAKGAEIDTSMVDSGKLDLSKLDISGESKGDYSELDIRVRNKTDEWQALDLTAQYFEPRNSKNQRLGISTKKKETVPLPPLEPIVKPEEVPELVPLVPIINQ